MIYRAKSSFSTQSPKGEKTYVYSGDTAREGHWLLDSNAAAFEPLVVKFDVQSKASEPARKGESKSA